MADIRLTQSTFAVRSGVLKTAASSAATQISSPGLAKPVTQVEVLDNTLRVMTPENISFEYQLAGPFRRIFAYLLDLLVSIVGFLVCAFLLQLIVAFAIIPLAQTLGIASWIEGLIGLMVGMGLVLYFIVYWFYGALMETYYNGQTLGKRWTHMRVLSIDGHSIDGVQATLRNFFRLLDVSPLVPVAALFRLDEPASLGIPTCLFGLIMMSFSRNFQRVGDLVAGTVVVNESHVREPGLLVFTDPRVPGLAALIPNHFVATPSLTKAIAYYADQRRFLPPARAREIAGHVAVPLLEQFNLMADTDHDLFLCSVYFKLFAAAAAADEDFQVATAEISI